MLPDQDKLLSQLYQDHFAKLTMYALAVLKNSRIFLSAAR